MNNPLFVGVQGGVYFFLAFFWLQGRRPQLEELKNQPGTIQNCPKSSFWSFHP